MIFKSLVAALAIGTVGGAALAQGKEDIYYIQIKLDALDANVGSADGVMGPKTRAAIADHAAEMGFKPTPEAMIEFYQERYWFDTEPVTEGALYDKLMTSFEDVLLDPYSAKFKDVVRLPSGNICGMVNAKNNMGAYTGFHHFRAASGSIKISEDHTSHLVMPPAIEDPESNKITYFCWLDI